MITTLSVNEGLVIMLQWKYGSKPNQQLKYTVSGVMLLSKDNLSSHLIFVRYSKMTLK